MTVSIQEKLQQLSIIALCCTISYSIPKNNVFSWIVILLSAVCVIMLAVKKEKYILWGSVVLGIYALKFIEDIPYLLNMLQEAAGLLTAVIIIGVHKKKCYKAFCFITVILAAGVLTFSVIHSWYLIMRELSIALSGSTSFIYYSRMIVFEWAAEIFACYVYPVMVSLLILKNNTTELSLDGDKNDI
ncbi:MAG: hypothetical protein IJ007_03675 [Oscillospiraceae bacterium]|nr:hypothetical protein [Oscillospiraceae bacterium]